MSTNSTQLSSNNRFLPAILLLFIGSGCSALIYEIVWFQMLQLVIGSSALSLGVLLGTFMGGMCLGSILLPRWISTDAHPLRVYGFLEAGIGIIGVVLLFLIPLVGGAYLSFISGGTGGLILRAVICSICLLPPTMLMGATLPAISRWVETTREGVAQLGFFYGANIVGAVAGCLCAGFYLLRVYDTPTATWVAVAINAVVAAVSLGLSRVSHYESSAEPESNSNDSTESAISTKLVNVSICLSGLTALGAEVVWTRQLSLMLGASVYTFSIILAVYLTGLGVGSSVGGLISRSGNLRPHVALGGCQLLIAFGMGWTAYILSYSLPYWPIDPELPSSPWVFFQLDIMRCFWAIFPATVFWGASFPLALAAAIRPQQDPGKTVGIVYAFNTVGAIIGALSFSVLGLAELGTQSAQQLLVVVALISAAVMLVPAIIGDWKTSENSAKATGAVVIVAMVSVGIGVTQTIPGMPVGLIGYGRNLPTWYEEDLPKFIYQGEGMNASIAVSEETGDIRNFHVSGKVVASTTAQDMRLQRLLGHLPALFHEEPKSVLIVGCGAGVTAGCFIPYSSIERIVICEIEPLIPQTAGKYFKEANHGVIQDPRVEVVHDDARHFILTTDEKFDIITSDPIHPWVKGAAALYSKEYFELSMKKLNPGGIVTQWVPLYESNLPAVKSEVATFFAAWPDGTVWANENQGLGYDIILLGQHKPMTLDIDKLTAKLNSKPFKAVLDSLNEVEMGSALNLLLNYAGRAKDLGPWMEDAELNLDRNLRLQYLAGLGLNTQEADYIYRSMLKFAPFPDDMFKSKGNLARTLQLLYQRKMELRVN